MMSIDTSVVLIRHCETKLNEERRFQGWLDPELSAAGLDRADRLQRVLDGVDWLPDTVWTSDLRRAHETLRRIAPSSSIRAEPRLREIHFGVFEGKRYEENLAEHGESFRAWLSDPEASPPEGGEPLSVFLERLRGWLRDAVAAGPVAAVTHLGPIRAVMAELWEVDTLSLLSFSLPPGAVIRVTWGPGEGRRVMRYLPDRTWADLTDQVREITGGTL